MKIITGRWSMAELERLLHESSQIPDTGMRIDFLSEQFIGIRYEKSTLTGNMNTREIFTINLGAMDCFTFIDYIEAMRLSESFLEFTENLRNIRYRSGMISFENRNHFFIDWREMNQDHVYDATETIGMENTKYVRKLINLKEDGTFFVSGLAPEDQKIGYMPSEALDKDSISRLRTGDYAGIYSFASGLDVSHVGIIIKTGDLILFRHASSSENYRKVVDEDLQKYLSGKPGLIILRPKG